MTAEEQWMKLATRALHAAQRGDNDIAGRLIERIDAEFDADTVVLAMLAWIDTLVAAAGPRENFRTMAFRDIDGTTYTIDDLRPEARWAARLVLARANDDHETFAALVMSVPDNAQYGNNVGELLRFVALNLNGLAVQHG